MSESNEHSEMGQDPPVSPGEYRIIPVDKFTGPDRNDAVDLSTLGKITKDRWKLILGITSLCLLLGILYACFSRAEYRSEAQVLPESDKVSQNRLNSLIQNYGGLLGVDRVGGASNDGSISPKVYPAIVQSLTFQYAVLQDTVYFADRDSSLTIYQYFKPGSASVNHKSGKIPREGHMVPQKLDTIQITSVSSEELKVINEMRSRVGISFDSQTGVMKINARMPDAVAAAQVCNNMIKRLRAYVKKYRTQKAQNLLDFTEDQFRIARRKFLEAKNKLAQFKDQNQNLSTATALSRQQYLQSEYNLAYDVYNNVAQKRIQARMNLRRSTPVFNILQKADVPLYRYKPKWIPILLVSIALGLVISFLVVAGAFILQQRKMI